jgi:type II secretory pathway pseudopilin PulG
MSGRQVLAALLAIVVATAVVPPALAWIVNRRRVAEARAGEAAIRAQLLSYGSEIRNLPPGTSVFCGDGAMPTAASAARPWLQGPRGRSDAMPHVMLPPDPWGNCYVVRLPAEGTPGGAGFWVLSAGTNGIVETDFARPDETAGDDILLRIQ